MSWLTETVVGPVLGVLLRRAVPVLVGAAMGALAALNLVPAEWAECVGAVPPGEPQSALSSNSPASTLDGYPLHRR